MATVNKSSLRAEFDALKARFESLCAGTMSAESRAVFDALLMLFELLMAVFMEKHTPKAAPTPASPPLRARTTRPPAPIPAPRARAPHTTVSAAPSAARHQGAHRRCVPALWRGPHRRRLHRPPAAHPHRHRVREGRASRRRTNQALPALPRRDARTLPPPDARTAAVRPRHQGLRRAPAHRADALAQTRRTIGRPHWTRGHAPGLRRAGPRERRHRACSPHRRARR